MVCLGNICRSPLAEGILTHKLAQANLKVVVDSAGLINYHTGELPDHRSIAVAKKYGIDISKQRARTFVKNDLKEFDFIFAMDHKNFENLQEYASNKEEENKIHLLLDFAGIKTSQSVPDPYYGNASDFENVFQLLDEACTKVTEKLKVHTSKLNLA
jgi:protein-tyrosine phosphatase